MEFRFGPQGLAGSIYKRDSNLKDRPGLVICHGFPLLMDTPLKPGETYKYLAEHIARELGWTVMIFSYRGCGDSPGNFSISGWLEDSKQAVAHLAQDVPQVWTAGFGSGGAFAICAGAESREVSGVISVGAPADFSIWAKNSNQMLAYSRKLKIISEDSFPENKKSWGKEFADLDIEAASTKLAPRPLLVVHGAEDQIVPVLDARALASAHGEAEIRIVERATHRLAVDPRVLAILLGWLDHQVPGRGANNYGEG